MSAHNDHLDPDIHLWANEDDALAFNTMKEQRDKAMVLMLKFASLKVHRDERDQWKQLAAERWKLEEEIERE